jgi:hypothetical protein
MLIVAVLTVTAWITAVQRIVYVRKATAVIDAAPADPDPATTPGGASAGRQPRGGAGRPT